MSRDWPSGLVLASISQKECLAYLSCSEREKEAVAVVVGPGLLREPPPVSFPLRAVVPALSDPDGHVKRQSPPPLDVQEQEAET